MSGEEESNEGFNVQKLKWALDCFTEDTSTQDSERWAEWLCAQGYTGSEKMYHRSDHKVLHIQKGSHMHVYTKDCIASA